MRTLDDHQLAHELAEAAGQQLLCLRESDLLVGRALGDAGDAVCEQLLSRALAVHRPDDALLSEEAADTSGRLDSGRVWIVDPLDGTREFSEGREDFAVHVALAVDGVPGPSAVALPGQGRVLSTANVGRSYRRGDGRLRIAVSRTRAPEIADRVAERLDADLHPLGSAGFKAMAVLGGEVDAYLHAGGQYEWDSAAPVGVALAAGLHASRIDGSDLLYNQPDPLLPDLLICHPDVSEQLLTAISEAGASIGGGVA